MNIREKKRFKHQWLKKAKSIRYADLNLSEDDIKLIKKLISFVQSLPARELWGYTQLSRYLPKITHDRLNNNFYFNKGESRYSYGISVKKEINMFLEQVKEYNPELYRNYILTIFLDE